MITIACVMKSGGVYDLEWVRRLQRGVLAHLSTDYRFVCLSDKPLVGVETIPLIHDWKGWWSKIELFRPGLFKGRVLYFDLDTIIVGDLASVANYPHHFTLAHEYYRPKHFCSTAMAWDATQSFGLYESFVQKPEKHMRRCDVELRLAKKLIGDQAFIETHLDDIGLTPDTFRDLFGERTIASYKVHQCERRPPADAVAVAFHGKPKPHEIKGGWVAEYWENVHA